MRERLTRRGPNARLGPITAIMRMPPAKDLVRAHDLRVSAIRVISLPISYGSAAEPGNAMRVMPKLVLICATHWKLHFSMLFLAQRPA